MHIPFATARTSRAHLAEAAGLALEALPNALLRGGPLAAAVAPAAMRVLAQGMAPARQAQFLAGRAWAARALLALGAGTITVGRAVDGRPEWPKGIVGSIAHDGQRATALVARGSDWQALGVDVEPFAPLPDDSANLVLTPAERNALAALDNDEPLRHGRLVFATKECVHKALHPLNGAWLEFDEVEIEFGDARLAHGIWRPRPLSDRARSAFAGLHSTGRWWRDETGWLAVLGLRSG